jgi:TolB-like protein/Flp pilus assembly protein TadD
MSNKPSFFSELKRRNVYKVAVAYAVAAWLLIQIATQVFPFFEIPNWAVRLVVVLLALGFPVALILAWAFEITPEGIKRESEIPAGHSITHRTGRKLVAITAVLAVIAAGLLVFRLVGTARWAVRSGDDDGSGTSRTASLPIPAKSIAVLPFENLSDDKSNAYFADGIQDEILTKLASIADLKVISRTSTAKYKSKPEDLKIVSQQLAVATVLEGTVQKSGDKVRVNVQLIDARADTHLWARSYDRELKDVFTVESEVAQEIADALRAKLSPSEASVLATAPTRDPEAYDLFLKGEYEQRQAEIILTTDSFDRADGFYRQALERDPNFALAAARLAESRLSRHWFISPLTARELDEVKTMVDRALTLAPNLAESHVALGNFYYHGHRQYELALTAYRRAIELQPNNVAALVDSAYVYRRRGEWERALSEMEKAEKLDPRDTSIPENIAATYLNLRQWTEAKRAASRSLALDPHNLLAMRVLFLCCINGEGDTEGAKRVVSNLSPGTRISPNAIRGNVSAIVDQRTYLSVLERDFAGALKDWGNQSADPAERMTLLSARVAIRVLAGNAASAKLENEEARALLEARLRDRPDDAYAMTQLSWTYLALERNADALRVAHQAAESLPIEKDAMAGPLFSVGLAEIQARAGEPREAVKALQRLLSIPAGMVVSVKRLKIDPVWDPIRNDPEFQKLLAGPEQIGPNK